MATVQQDINVRINAALNGIPQVRDFVGFLQRIKDSGNQKIELGADSSGVNELSTAVDNLGKKIDSVKPSKFQEISTLLQGLAAGSTIIKNLGGGFESIGKGVQALRTKAGELVEGVAARAGPLIDSIKTKAA